MRPKKQVAIRLESAGAVSPTWDCASEAFEIDCLREDRDPKTAGSAVQDVPSTSNQALDLLNGLLPSLISSNDPQARYIGFVGYDMGRHFEDLPDQSKDELGLPVCAFARGRSLRGRVGPKDYPSPKPPASTVTSNFTREQYITAVQHVIDYISAGDVFQVNLSQRFRLPTTFTPTEIYSRLNAQTPASYGALLDFGDFALVCNSPELFFRVILLADGSRKIITRPIKGTRPLGQGMADALRHSAKDEAELNMIVDLERNDLGRICVVGSVKVTQMRTIEAHPTVYHGVATIEAILRPEIGVVDIFRAMFPGGSITGAPKIRAMEIIEELEPVRRGPYCGAIGYVAADGSMEFNVAIRTMIIKDGWAHIPVGGGIVADSDPADEYEETLIKARAMFAALGLGDKGELR